MDSRMLELALKIADDAARGILLMETLPAGDGGGWMDLESIANEAEPGVAEAVEYLNLRGLLDRKEGSTRFVRLMSPVLLN